MVRVDADFAGMRRAVIPPLGRKEAVGLGLAREVQENRGQLPGKQLPVEVVKHPFIGGELLTGRRRDQLGQYFVSYDAKYICSIVRIVRNKASHRPSSAAHPV